MKRKTITISGTSFWYLSTYILMCFIISFSSVFQKMSFNIFHLNFHISALCMQNYFCALELTINWTTENFWDIE